MKRIKALLKMAWPEKHPVFEVKLNIQLNRRTREEGNCDFTSHQLMIGAAVFYAHFFFEHSHMNYWQKTPENKLSVNIYYGLGTDVGPKSAVKRHKHVCIWNRKGEGK